MVIAAVEFISLAAQITTTLVAVLALTIGLRNEKRSQQRFDQQLSQGREIAQASVRPLLTVEREGYEEEKAITLVNHGPGAAIIKSISFVRGKRKASDIAELLDVDEAGEITWNENTEYVTPYYLAGKSSEDAFRITHERLEEDDVPAERIQTLLDEIEEQLDEINITILYEDVFRESFELKP